MLRLMPYATKQSFHTSEEAVVSIRSSAPLFKIDGSLLISAVIERVAGHTEPFVSIFRYFDVSKPDTRLNQAIQVIQSFLSRVGW